LFAIPTNPLLATNYTAPDNASAQSAAASGTTLISRLTTQRAAKLDTVVLTTDLAPLATSAQVTAAQAAVIDRGNTAWVTATGFATVNPDNLTLSRLSGLLSGDFTRFTATALSNAPAGSSGSGGLTAEQATQLAATATTAQVNAARDAVITRGDEAWVTGSGGGSGDGGLTTAQAQQLAATATAAQLTAAQAAIENAVENIDFPSYRITN